MVKLLNYIIDSKQWILAGGVKDDILLYVYRRFFYIYFCVCLILMIKGGGYIRRIVTTNLLILTWLQIRNVRFMFYFQLMLDSWNQSIFYNIKHRLQDSAMKLVHAERNGEAFDSQLVIGVRESYGNASNNTHYFMIMINELSMLKMHNHSQQWGTRNPQDGDTWFVGMIDRYRSVQSVISWKAFRSICHTVFDLIGARGAYINLFSTTSAKWSSSGR